MQGPQHLAKAVLLMVTNNIGSIAMLHARAAGVAHIMFTGSFLHDNKVRFESFVIHSFIPFKRIRYGFMEPPMVSTV
jgi:pantothenate kinase